MSAILTKCHTSRTCWPAFFSAACGCPSGYFTRSLTITARLSLSAVSTAEAAHTRNEARAERGSRLAQVGRLFCWALCVRERTDQKSHLIAARQTHRDNVEI